MRIEELEKSVQDWKETVETNAFADSVGAFAESLVSASPVVDKSSTWAAAGVAAVAGLAITNIDKMTSVYNPNEVKWLFSALAVSMFFALVQKYLSSICATSLIVAEELKSKFPPVLTTFEDHEKQIEDISKQHGLKIQAEYDFTKVMEAYINLFPKWSLVVMKSRIEKSFSDRNYGHKYLVKIFTAQSSCAFIQYVSILVFVCLAAAYI